MRSNTIFTAYLLALSAIAGYMLSKASLVGRVGIFLFYNEYAFLRTWWKGTVLIFAVLLILFGIQYLLHKKANQIIARGTQVTALALAATGLLLTYMDFRDDLAHRWMGERFHIGSYLFWIGWMSISLFLLTKKKPAIPTRLDSTDSLIP
jgi:inner membrane protein involved in colicin E2 resistance